MIHTCPACGTPNDDWRPFCTKCSLRLDGARRGVPGTAGSALEHYSPVGAAATDAGDLFGRRPTRRSRTPLIVVVLAALACAGAGGVVIVRHLRSHRSDEIAAPRQWDPRLAPLAHIAEHLRGLRFKHPVAARFYSDAAFNQLDDQGFAKPENQQEIARISAELRALGMAPAHLDLSKSAKTLVDASVLAFYDPKTKSVSVRGTTLDVSHDVTLVHELTHALQDQYFDLNKLEKAADKSKTGSYDPLIEGDATDVEHRYVDTLSKARKAEYDREQNKLNGSVSAKLGAVPDVLVLGEQLPYDFGEQFVKVLRTYGGETEVNAAFHEPPLPDRLYEDPLAYMNGEKPVSLARPRLPKGATLLEDQDETGSMGLFIMLSGRIDQHTALAASDAWRGDRTTLYRNGSTICTEIQFATANTNDGNTLDHALAAWSKKIPSVHAALARPHARLVVLNACDAGARTPAPTHGALHAYPLPLNRLALLDTFLAQGADPDTAWCAASKVVYTYDAATLDGDPGTKLDQTQFVARLRGWITACRNAT